MATRLPVTMEENGNVKRSSRVRKVHYQPPSAADIRSFADAVSKALGTALDEVFDTPEFRHDLADLIRAVGVIRAAERNKTHDALDTDTASE